jgi:hypothetical protein
MVNLTCRETPSASNSAATSDSVQKNAETQLVLPKLVREYLLMGLATKMQVTVVKILAMATYSFHSHSDDTSIILLPTLSSSIAYYDTRPSRLCAAAD